MKTAVLFLALLIGVHVHEASSVDVAISTIEACPMPGGTVVHTNVCSNCGLYSSSKKRKRGSVASPGSKKALEDANQELIDDQATGATSSSSFFTNHLPWAAASVTIPSELVADANPCWLFSRGYINLYSRSWRTTLFTAHKLTPTLISGSASRRESLNGTFTAKTGKEIRSLEECFRPDIRLAAGHSSKCTEFSGISGVVRGHMVTAYDLKYAEGTHINSFVLSNIAPSSDSIELQLGKVEAIAQAAANSGKEVYVLSGPIMKDPPATFGRLVDNSSVMQTDHFFKVVAIPNGPGCLIKTFYKIDAMNFVKFTDQNAFTAAISITLPSLSITTRRSTRAVTQCALPVSRVRSIANFFENNVLGGFVSTSPTRRRRLSRSVDAAFLCSVVNNTVRQNNTDVTIDSNMAESRTVGGPSTIFAAPREGVTIDLSTLLTIDTSILGHVTLLNITYDCNSTQLNMHLAIEDDFNIVPGFLAVTNCIISLRATLFPRVRLDVLVFSGNWQFGDLDTFISAQYDLGHDELLLTAAISEGFTLDITQFIQHITGSSLTIPLPSVTFSQLALVGSVNTYFGGGATAVVSGRLGRQTVHLVLQRSASGEYKKALLADIHDFSLAALVMQLSGKDISAVPFFGSLTVSRIGITVASDDIYSYIIPEVYSVGNIIGGTLYEGTSAALSIDIGELPLLLSMEYSEGDFAIDITSSRPLTVQALIQAIPGFSIDFVGINIGLSNILNVRVTSFQLDTAASCLKIGTDFSRTLTFFGGLLQVTNPSLYIIMDLKPPRNVTLEFGGEVVISNTNYEISIRKNHIINRYVLSAKFGHIPLSDIANRFSAAIIPDEFEDILGGSVFSEFSINNALISLPLASKPPQLYISGYPIIRGHGTTFVSAVVIRKGTRTVMITGIELGSVNIASLLHQLTSVNLLSFPMINQDLTAVILISPESFPGLRLTGEHFSGLNVQRGLSIQAMMGLPSNCDSDPFCSIVRNLLGADVRFSLQGAIMSATSYSLFAGVNDITLGPGFTLTSAGFVIEVESGRAEIGIQGSMILDVANPPIILTGGIAISTMGVVLELSMTGCWMEAFGLKWICICNLHFLAGIVPTPIPLPSLQMGGQVKLGDPQCGQQIDATCFVGIDTLNPLENYYYGSIEGPFTLSSILEAFCQTILLPRPLAESGFPEGFLSSYSLMPRVISHASLKISAGFSIKGRLNVLGLNAYTEVTLNLPTRFFMNISLPPLVLGGGLLTMKASRHSSDGPRMIANLVLLPIPSVNIQCKGYISVLGFSVESALRITNSQYEFQIEGRMLNLFQVSLRIAASYGDISTANFDVHGSFKSDLCSNLKDRVTRAIQRSSGEATSAISSAQEAVDRQRQVFEDADRELRNAQHEVDRANGVFDDAVREVNNVRNSLNSACQIRNCGSVRICVPCPTGFACCGRVWGHCVCTYPTFGSCCSNVPDAVCHTQNAACTVIIEPIKAALSVAERIVDESRHSLDIAIAAIQVIRETVNGAQHSLDIAIGILEAVKQTYRVGAEGAALIARVGLGGVIDIREITFDASLSVAGSGSFGCSVRATFAGHAEVTISTNINIRDLSSIAADLANEVVSGLADFLD